MVALLWWMRMGDKICCCILTGETESIEMLSLEDAVDRFRIEVSQ